MILKFSPRYVFCVAKFENDTEIAKAKRDYELKKAAYDIEVFTKVCVLCCQIWEWQKLLKQREIMS